MEEEVVGDFALGILLEKGGAQAAECPAKSVINSRAFFLKSSISLHKCFSFLFFLRLKG